MPVAEADLPCWRRTASPGLLQAHVLGIPQEEAQQDTVLTPSARLAPLGSLAEGLRRVDRPHR